jgi:hypothetical protein
LLQESIKIELLKKISNINKSTPGVWIVVSNIFQNKKYTLILDNTLIISIYELTEKKLIMLYKVLKELIKTKSIIKVINKKEFLIVKLRNDEVTFCLTNCSLWKLIDIQEILEKQFKNSIINIIDDYVYVNDLINEYNISNYLDKYIKIQNINNSKEIIFEYSYVYKEFEMTILDNFRKIKSN